MEDFTTMPHIWILGSIDEAKEALKSYSDRTLTDEEKIKFNEMTARLAALEAEWQRRLDREEKPKEPKDMTSEELSEAMEDVDDARKRLCRCVRRTGRGWRKEEEEEYSAMDEWAGKVWGEILKRQGEK